jgi:hypothetical protein
VIIHHTDIHRLYKGFIISGGLIHGQPRVDTMGASELLQAGPEAIAADVRIKVAKRGWTETIEKHAEVLVRKAATSLNIKMPWPASAEAQGKG